MSQKILIVDDERDICEILEFNLANEGYEVSCAHSAEDAQKVLTPEYSLMLLDVMMGGMSGYKFAEVLRRDGNQIPIIFLTAKDTENDMLTGFSVGGDDYIPKPFSIKEVVARVKAVLKRHQPSAKSSASNKLTFGKLSIDRVKKELSIDGKKIILTKTEFEILLLLADKPECVYSRTDIISNAWKDSPYITERTVDVHIARLRKKLGNYAALISNRSGYGYLFDTANL
jgi:DNA-binding response OmpR family regulator